ncbi:hypothetical protein [Ornithinibacillus californiensis]|uniref:hypothetical protein n=1 Tax=Ornithinibacillus californiensis TaxID=161536 RepID=UPI00064DAED0|nr:hypothetical protein [Ornithinibacillus californiensis]
MKKALFVLFTIIVVILAVGWLIPDKYSDIRKAEYTKYDHLKEEFGDKILIKDKDKINRLTKVLNKTKRENAQYEKAFHEDIILTLYYENGEKEDIYIWIEFGQRPGFDLLESEKGTLKLTKEKYRKELVEILK